MNTDKNKTDREKGGFPSSASFPCSIRVHPWLKGLLPRARRASIGPPSVAISEKCRRAGRELSRDPIGNASPDVPGGAGRGRRPGHLQEPRTAQSGGLFTSD